MYYKDYNELSIDEIAYIEAEQERHHIDLIKKCENKIFRCSTSIKDSLENDISWLSPFAGLAKIDYEIGYTLYGRRALDLDSLTDETLEEIIATIKRPWWESILEKYIGKDYQKVCDLYDKIKDKWTPEFETFTEENLKLLKELIGIKD